MQPVTDAELVALAQTGDREAYSLLALRWRQPLERFIGRLLGNREEARDASQEALLRAWVNLHRLREPERFSPWIHRIALNLCRDRGRSTRSRALREVPLDATPAAETALPQPTPYDTAERQNLAEVLDALLARLPREQRTAILLRELHGLTSQEIAAVSGVPAATVRSRIFYGLKVLRAMLPEYGLAPAPGPRGGPGP